MFARIVTTLSGIVLLIYGIVAAASPLPLGVPLVVLSLLMIAGANPAARPLIRRARGKWSWFDWIVESIGRRSPGRFQEVIDETDPDQDVDHGLRNEKTEGE